MKGTQDGKRLRVQEDVLSEDEDKELQEAKKIRVEAGEISDEGLSKAIRSCSPSSLLPVELESEIQDAASHPKESHIAETSEKNIGRCHTGSKQVPRRIDTGIFSQIPPELLYNILKFLSSEVQIYLSILLGTTFSFSLFCFV